MRRKLKKLGFHFLLSPPRNLLIFKERSYLLITEDNWLMAISYAKSLDDSAQNEDWLPLLTNMLVIKLQSAYTKSVNAGKDCNLDDIRKLINEIGNYGLKGITVNYNPDFQGLCSCLEFEKE